MLKIRTWRDPYDAGFSTTRLKEIEFKEGLTVLVGCNGIGKTTLLMNIREFCKEQDIPVLSYDNLKDGGLHAMDSAMYHGDTGLFGALYSSSEGESIKINFGTHIGKIREFLKIGFCNRLGDKVSKIMGRETPVKDKRRVILFDGIDSGLSVDAVVEVKQIFDLILKDSQAAHVETYIIVSANEYELARNAACFNTAMGKYIELPDYEAYRSFVLKTREQKEKRYNKKG